MNYVERAREIKQRWTDEQGAKSVLSALSPEKQGGTPSVTCVKSVISAKSPLSTSAPNEVTDYLLSRLQAGSQWLTTQHQTWLEGKPGTASHERFSVALAAWTEMEQSLRQVFGYEGCIFGPGGQCTDDAPAICDACTAGRSSSGPTAPALVTGACLC
jgi:hypothetical protein